MSAILETLVEQLFTTTPVDKPKFLWVCSGCGAVGIGQFAPSDCSQCGTKEAPALAEVTVLDRTN
jgi:rubrerythrin